MNTLGAPIGGVVGHTVPMEGFDQGEHGAGTGVSGGHVPSASNQARGYGQDQSGFNSGIGGEHASGGISKGTPIADKFMGTSGQSHAGDAVSGAYSGGGTRDALTGESNAHTTGAGVGVLGENLHSQGHHHHSHHTHATEGASAGAYTGSINRSSAEGHSTSSARDAALTGTAGAASAAALGAGIGSHGHSHEHHHSHSTGTGTGVGAVGGAGGHYSTQGTQGSHTADSHSNVGTGASAGVLAGQQAGARGTHGDSGITTATGAGVGAGAGAAAAGAAGTSSRDTESNTRGEPLSNPKDLDSGTRHGLIFDEATGKYVHRHELEEKR